MPEPDQATRVIRFGVFEVDLHTTELRKQGVRIRLPLQSFQVLEALLLQPGELVTRKELKEKLWPADSFGDFEHGLNAAVNRVREALGDSSDNPRFVETLPRRGYRFLAPVNGVPRSTAAGVLEDGEAGKRVASPTSEDSAEHPARIETLPRRGYRLIAPLEKWADQFAVKLPRSRRALLLIAIILGVASPLVAWLWIRYREAKQPEPDFQRLSFGRGMIQSARFTPDGQSVIYGAAWDGKPVQLFWSRANSPESRPLGVEADILAVSPSGEMAVLLNQHYGNIASQGTLALMSLTGSAPRKLLDSVQDADWSPDGSKLAITHYVGGRCALEFPLGKVLYRTTGGAWLSHPRVSPRGDQIAFLDHPFGNNNSGFVAVIDRNGRKKTLSSDEIGDLSGMAWDPAGDSIWFSGYDATTRGARGLFKVTLAGLQHQVRREPGNLTLHDVSRGRRLLLTRDSIRGEVFGRIHSESKEHELSWLDNSFATDLSPDGGTIVLAVEGEGSATGCEVYLRKTYDSPAVRLGDGIPRQLSPDAKWVLTGYPFHVGIGPTPAPQLLLIPTGTGEPRTLTNDSISHFGATLLPNRKTFVFEGFEPGHARRSWIQNVGGKPQPITPEGTVGHRVSPDEKLLAAVDPEQKYWLYPIGGGPPAPLSFIEPGEDVIRWSADGKHLFVASDGIPVAVYRIEIPSGRRQLVGKVAPSDLAGVWNIGPVLITPDGRSYVYSDFRILSDLFLATGLR